MGRVHHIHELLFGALSHLSVRQQEIDKYYVYNRNTDYLVLLKVNVRFNMQRTTDN